MNHDTTHGTANAVSTAPSGYDTAFFGHPRGLATLFFTELWERFSYYGMRALLVLYMTAPLDMGGLGFSVAEAGGIYGLYTAMVYLTAVPGGMIADNFLGQRRAVLYGGIIIALGHICMAFSGLPNFYLGLGLIIVGTGLLKPNISTMVGSLYAAQDKRRDGGFSIFYMGINLGGFFAPLACGFLAQDKGFQAWLKGVGFDPTHSWHWGFAAAAVGMMLGIAQFLYGGKFLGEVGLEPAPTDNPDARAALKRKLQGGTGLLLAGIALLIGLSVTGIYAVSVEQLSAAFGTIMLVIVVAYFAQVLRQPDWSDVERKRIGVVAVLFVFSALFWSAFEQAGSSFNLFADRLVNNEFLGFSFPSSWFQSVNSIFIIVLAPAFAVLWVKLGDKEPSSPAKFAYGLLFVGLGFAVVAVAAMISGPDAVKVSPMWLVSVYLLHTIGELCLSPVGLSLVTKLAPARAVGQLMGVWFMSISLGNYMGGQIAGLFEQFPLPQLFGAVFGTTILATLILALLVKPIRGLMGGVH